MAKKEYPIDTSGTDEMSSLIMNLLNSFPGLNKNQQITFATLGKTGGIAFYPSNGGAITDEKRSITGHVKQTCSYPFVIIYSAMPKTETARIQIKEFLDALGKWLQKQPVTINDKVVKLDKYPVCVTKGRVIHSITLTQSAFISGISQNGLENWEIICRVDYKNEFDL